MTYEILDHPADVKFRTYGATLEEAFSEVVTAVSDLVGGVTDSHHQTTTRETDLEARNLEALLFDFLNQIILFQDLEDAVVTRASNLDIEETDTGYRLSAVLQASRIPPDQALLDLKAPTYSQMMVIGNGEWTIEAVIDV
ncbi:archease [Halorubrum rubrum]|uniref:Archease n=1 Tax=Halorubrum rubrum TaxID=1126240 RepID=A0ABD5QWV3_9EURY|nr:archease [Halorubrum rubrum]